MRSGNFFLVLFLLASAGTTAAQSVGTFPSADSMLQDAKHKEPKSGIQIGPGNTISIQSGVGTPTTINVLSFGKGGALLAAGKDFGRVVVWDVANRSFLCAIDTGQSIVHAVAISPDGQVLATAGEGDGLSLKLWHLPDGKLLQAYRSFDSYITSLAFGPTGSWLVIWENGVGTQVIDVTTGKRLVNLEETYAPVLSPDGSILMAVNKTEFVFWNTANWTQQRTLPRVPDIAIPLALDPNTDSFVITSSWAFQLVRLSTGELLSNAPEQPLPKFNAAAGGFAAFDTSVSGLVFGHSDDRLWAWDSHTGQTCVSDMMFSESGSLSPDGSVLAGAKDNSILAQGQSPDGVEIWDTRRLAEKCGFGSPGSTETASPRP
jgi:WD40 repeat protein